MISRNVQLAPLTTLHVGGPAQFFAEIHAEKDIEDAIAYARDHRLPLYPLGAGSNVLVPDVGVSGIVLKMLIRDITLENEGDITLLIAGAGALWEDVVDSASAQGLFGIENLAGIPGTLGGAVVQNIGAYGAELKDVFAYADCIDSTTGSLRRITLDDAAFGYRTSLFKERREYIVTRVAVRLTKSAVPSLSYPDLARAHAEGVSLTTPKEVARTVRAIRALKFPQDSKEGTAGSFFKNPIISQERADALIKRFPGVPMFPQTMSHRTRRGAGGAVKISLAWILDHVLSLKGFSMGRVRLYEKHPLVIVASAGAHATEVDAFAREVSERVFAATGIEIEREVETFGV